MKLRLSLHLACHNRIWNVSIYGNNKDTARSSRKFELGPLSYQSPNSSQIGVYPTISLFWKQPNCKVAQSRSHCIGSILLHPLYPHYRKYYPSLLVQKNHQMPLVSFFFWRGDQIPYNSMITSSNAFTLCTTRFILFIILQKTRSVETFYFYA